MRAGLLAILLVAALAPPAHAAGGSYDDVHTLTLGGAWGVQEIVQYRVDLEAGALISIALSPIDALPGTDLDLLLLFEGSCDNLGCGTIVAHRMDARTSAASIETTVDRAGTYIVEVEAWVAARGTQYALSIAWDDGGAAVNGPDRLVGAPGPAFLLHKEADTLDALA